MCIIKLGNIVEGLITVVTFGWGKDIASYVALRFFNKTDCGCEERRIWLNKIVGCKEKQIKLF